MVNLRRDRPQVNGWHFSSDYGGSKCQTQVSGLSACISRSMNARSLLIIRCCYDRLLHWVAWDQLLSLASGASHPGDEVAGHSVGVLAPVAYLSESHGGRDIGDGEGKHNWGQCLVQDFTGGPDGHVMLSYTGGTYLVRQGMWRGWAAENGGAPGKLRCPTSDEYDYLGGKRQDFQGGSLAWYPGQKGAVVIDSGSERAISWAMKRLGLRGEPGYSGACLAFVVQAYVQGQGTRPEAGPWANDAKAADWWHKRSGGRHPSDVEPPRGAFAVWDYAADSQGRAGHIALSLGGGYAVTTKWGGRPEVRVVKIGDYRNHYLGWVPAD